MMTTLDFLPNNDDTGETQEEKQLYEHIMKCIGKKTIQEQEEGSVLHTSVVFTSLALLWNICQCSDLNWE